MSIVKRNDQSPKAEFIGKGWKNTNSETNEEFVRITLDQDIDEVVLKPGYSLYLNDNEKREGKNDADYRVSIRKDNLPKTEKATEEAPKTE